MTFSLKMSKNIKYSYISIFTNLKNKNKHFHNQKTRILTYNVDLNKLVVCKKFLFGKKGFKYVIGYKNDKK